MITIKKNGKFIIPENEVLIGHAGDNLHATKEFFVEGVTDVSLVYRMYLQFDDGSTNFFLLESESVENGTRLIWNITSDQIYKSGIVKMQIKASNSSGVVFHSAITSLVAHTSIEFGESYKNKENSEFLQHEQYLNDLLEKERKALEELREYSAGITDGSLMDSAPTENSVRAVQSGGIYNTLKGKLNNVDGSVKSNNIEDGAITADKIADGVITTEKLSWDLQDVINEVKTTDFMCIVDRGELTDKTSLDSPSFISYAAVFQFRVSGALAASIKGTENSFTAELRCVSSYQILTDVETQQTYVRKVNKVAPSFSAEAWEEKSDVMPNSVSYEDLDINLRGLLSELQSGGNGESMSGLAVYLDEIRKVNESGVAHSPITLEELNCIDTNVFSCKYNTNDISANYGTYQVETSDLNLVAGTKYKLKVARTGGTRNVQIRLQTKSNNFSEDGSLRSFYFDGTTSDFDFTLTADEISRLKYITFQTTSNSAETFVKVDISISSITSREWAVRKIYTAVFDASVFDTENPYRVIIFNLSNVNGSNVYNQIAIGEDGVVRYRSRSVADSAEWSEFKTSLDEKVEITEEKLTGYYELSANTMTVAGIIDITDEENSARIRMISNYVPVQDASVIGKGSNGKYYIIDVSTSAPKIIFTVRNTDGTLPTESDTIHFTATLFKS